MNRTLGRRFLKFFVHCNDLIHRFSLLSVKETNFGLLRSSKIFPGLLFPSRIFLRGRGLRRALRVPLATPGISHRWRNNGEKSYFLV